VLTATRPHALAASTRSVTLTSRLYAARERAGADIAVTDDAVRISYADLTARAEALAGGLRERGVSPGDVVLIQLPNWWETVVAAWGTWLAGAVVLPVVPIYRAHELGFILHQVRPAAAITAQTYRGYDHAVELRRLMDAHGLRGPVVAARSQQPVPGVEELAALLTSAAPLAAPTADADDIALVLYTSGTTASPKGVLHSHRTLLAESDTIRAACRLTSDDRVFMPSPLSHITGLSYAVVLTADLGAGSVLLDRWEPSTAVDLIERNRCTFTVSATPFLRGLSDTYEQRGLIGSTLRTFVCGGADIPPELVRRAHRVMGTAVLRTYGSTEMPTLAMADPDGDLDAGADTEGVLLGSNEMALRASDDGVDELVCRGPELFLGYVDPALNEASFTADGFFRTGDTATIDDGVLRITGRIKDIINRGGEKFSSAEVEWGILSHPLVDEVSVVGYPDDRLGERACAFVVPAGDAAPTLEDLRDHLVSAGFALQKVPERLAIVDALPRTASGKIQKFRLRDLLLCAQPAHETESG
jgi:cyclohexanecarboxylate-CoA ligase